jgi:transposase
VLHANAVLTPRQRLARLVVEENWPKSRAAEFFGVAWTTADRWAERYRAEDKAGMTDRSSRPHTSPAKTDPARTKRIVSLRLRKRWGPVRLAAECGVAPATAGAVLWRAKRTRCVLTRGPRHGSSGTAAAVSGFPKGSQWRNRAGLTPASSQTAMMPADATGSAVPSRSCRGVRLR